MDSNEGNYGTEFVEIGSSCLERIEIGFEHERAGFIEKYEIQGEWKSDSSILGWLSAGFQLGWPEEVLICQCGLSELNMQVGSLREMEDSIFTAIARVDWLSFEFHRKSIFGRDDDWFAKATENYLNLDSLCRVDPGGVWADFLPGPKWLEYQVWAFNNFYNSIDSIGLALPGIVTSRTLTSLDETFFEYRLVLANDSITLFRTIFNISAVGYPEIIW